LGLPAEVECEQPYPAWSRGLNLSAPVNARFEPFEIRRIASEEGDHLVGEFWFFNYIEGNHAPPDVTIKGTRKHDGTFWPEALAQVSSERNGPWTTLGSPLTPGEIASLTVAGKAEQERFYVNLDIFRPMIGKMTYGRVILKTGDSALFGLEDLLPPKTEDELKAEKARTK